MRLLKLHAAWTVLAVSTVVNSVHGELCADDVVSKMSVEEQLAILDGAAGTLERIH